MGTKWKLWFRGMSWYQSQAVDGRCWWDMEQNTRNLLLHRDFFGLFCIIFFIFPPSWQFFNANIINLDYPWHFKPYLAQKNYSTQQIWSFTFNSENLQFCRVFLESVCKNGSGEPTVWANDGKFWLRTPFTSYNTVKRENDLSSSMPSFY